MNILEKANGIVYRKEEERDRQYGPFFECMKRATRIYNAMQGPDGHRITTVDFYKAMVAMKLAREAYHHKEDNLLDAVAYMASWNDFVNGPEKI